jgi:hypothetical protein
MVTSMRLPTAARTALALASVGLSCVPPSAALLRAPSLGPAAAPPLRRARQGCAPATDASELVAIRTEDAITSDDRNEPEGTTQRGVRWQRGDHRRPPSTHANQPTHRGAVPISRSVFSQESQESGAVSRVDTWCSLSMYGCPTM